MKPGTALPQRAACPGFSGINGHHGPRLVLPTDPAPAPAAPHPDDRRTATIKAAQDAGQATGYKAGFMRGWRTGVGHALVFGILLGALDMHASTALIAMLRALP